MLNLYQTVLCATIMLTSLIKEKEQASQKIQVLLLAKFMSILLDLIIPDKIVNLFTIHSPVDHR